MSSNPTPEGENLLGQEITINLVGWSKSNYLCAWGNDAASEVLTEARQLLVENYFQTPSLAWVTLRPLRISGRAPQGVKPYKHGHKILHALEVRKLVVVLQYL